jgi:hypothetical protein
MGINLFPNKDPAYLTPIFTASFTRGLAVLLVRKISFVKLAKCPAVFRIARFPWDETI